MCKSVLNDEWVSHPSFSSEDSVFMAHKKNVYEEALHRAEEERHEYDFHIDALVRTISVLEPLNHKIMGSHEERSIFASSQTLVGRERRYTNALSKRFMVGRQGSRSYRQCRTRPHWRYPSCSRG
jgi:paired amphipathic helix protein Sin3a